VPNVLHSIAKAVGDARFRKHVTAMPEADTGSAEHNEFQGMFSSIKTVTSVRCHSLYLEAAAAAVSL
jgi:hypothetical protein